MGSYKPSITSPKNHQPTAHRLSLYSPVSRFTTSRSIAFDEDIISKSFHCKHGKAYLFSKVANVTMGETEDRMMMTGKHTVPDIFCVSCGSIVDWKYETAHEKSRSTRKENQFLTELRYRVLVGATTG